MPSNCPGSPLTINAPKFNRPSSSPSNSPHTGSLLKSTWHFWDVSFQTIHNDSSETSGQLYSTAALDRACRIAIATAPCEISEAGPDLVSRDCSSHRGISAVPNQPKTACTASLIRPGLGGTSLRSATSWVIRFKRSSAKQFPI
ncbi:hypothetical protein D3C86_1780240 [compost metagenome]